MPQQSLSDFVDDMEKAGLLVRVTEEKRVDELPAVMEANPLTAVLVEKVTDCEFQFLANAYSNQDQTAWALGCDKSETGRRMVELGKGRIKPEIVDTAPCKEVILTGDDVDLTRLPLFLHHDRDGHAYTNDNLVVSKHPDTGVYDWGIYRSMFRTKNEKIFDMTCTSHRARLNAQAAQAKGQNLELAIVLGGPLVDKVAALTGVPPGTDDFEVLGNFYGHPAKLVKCETIDLLVPANAEIVIECELMATEGLTHDEGPYGEFTGMYGGGIKANFRAVVKAMTFRKGGIFQHATIGGLHPWYTDNMLQLPMIESDLYGGLAMAGIDVKEVRAPLGRVVEHRLREDQAEGRGRFEAGARRDADLLEAGASEDRHGIRRGRRHLGRQRRAVRDGVPIHAAPRHGDPPERQHHDGRPDDRRGRGAGNRVEDRLGLHDSDQSQVRAVALRPQHRVRTRRSATGRRRDVGGGADDRHGGASSARRPGRGRKSSSTSSGSRTAPSTGRSAIFGTNSDAATTNRGTATRSPTPTLRSTSRSHRRTTSIPRHRP